MKCIRYPRPQEWADLCRRPSLAKEALFAGVRQILTEVRTGGDEALRRLTKKFDQAIIGEIESSDQDLSEASARIDQKLLVALCQAKENIERFHAAQRPTRVAVETMPGVRCWQESRPIERVGLYIPGGTAPLFSTVLMLALPAKLAGCREIILCTPPGRDGTISPAILAAAALCGVTRVCKVGGAQAIAALAYGTQSIPQVSKIFGPGNQYVTAAKQLVSLEGVAIDIPAGPSEVLIIADDAADPRFVAADLLSQAEHGRDSQVVLVATSESLLTEVKKALAEQLAQLPRREIADAALASSVMLLMRSTDEAIAFSNRYAPEHLIIATKNYEELAARVANAGSVFLGNFTPESAGDYASGTNHTLPTGGCAAGWSGVSLESFLKKVTFQQISERGLAALGPIVATMAEGEGLRAHARAVQVRLEGK